MLRSLCSLVIAAAMFALVLADDAAAQELWQTVTGPDSSFTVEMPPGKVSYFRDELKKAR